MVLEKLSAKTTRTEEFYLTFDPGSGARPVPCDQFH